MENEHERHLSGRRNPDVVEVFALLVHHFFLQVRQIEVSYFFARERIAYIAALDLCDRILTVEQLSFDHYEADGFVGAVENFALNYEHLPGVNVFQVVSLNAVGDRDDRFCRFFWGGAFAR